LFRLPFVGVSGNEERELQWREGILVGTGENLGDNSSPAFSKALGRFANLIKNSNGFADAVEDVSQVVCYVIHLKNCTKTG
jgi:hypothetical protein